MNKTNTLLILGVFLIGLVFVLPVNVNAQDCRPVSGAGDSCSIIGGRIGNINSCTGNCTDNLRCPSGQTLCSSVCTPTVSSSSCTTTDGRAGRVDPCGVCQPTGRCPGVQVDCGSGCQDPVGSASACTAENRTYNSCSGCGGCISGFLDCGDEGCKSAERVACPEPNVWDACSGACSSFARLQSGAISTESGAISITGDLRTEGDIYLNDENALRIDGSGITDLNIGNWGRGATGVNVNIWGSLLVNGNIDLLAGSTVDGVNLDDVLIDIVAGTGISISRTDHSRTIGISGDFILNPSSCLVDQVLQWSGSSWICADVSAGGSDEEDPVHIRWLTNPLVPSLLVGDSRPVAFMSAVGGRVGIGTTAPATIFEIQDSSPTPATLRVTDITQNPEIQLKYSGVNNEHWGIYANRADSSLRIWGPGPVGSDRLVINPSGNIGIGTENPTERLDVGGNINLTGNITLSPGSTVDEVNLDNVLVSTGRYSDPDWITEIIATKIDFIDTNCGMGQFMTGIRDGAVAVCSVPPVGGGDQTLLDVLRTGADASLFTDTVSIGGRLNVGGNIETSNGDVMLNFGHALWVNRAGPALLNIGNWTGSIGGGSIVDNLTRETISVPTNPTSVHVFGNLTVDIVEGGDSGSLVANKITAPEICFGLVCRGAWIDGGVTDHGALTGLTVNDHTQYYLQTGDTRALSVGGILGVAGRATFDGGVTINGSSSIIESGTRINVDNATDGILEIGNTASGNAHLRLFSSNNSAISEVVFRQGVNDRWSLSTRGGTPNFEIWRSNGTNWLSSALSINYSTGNTSFGGNILLNDGNTVDGVNLDDVVTNIVAGTGISISRTDHSRTIGISGDFISNPSSCLIDQVLQWSGSSWICEDVSAGIEVELDPVHTIWLSAPLVPSLYVGISNAAAFMSAVGGRVGIGTTTPATIFEIEDGSLIPTTLRITDITQNPEIQLKYSGFPNEHWGIYANRADSSLRIWGPGPSGSNRLVINPSGNIGIGTENPTERLDVFGNINLTGNITLSPGSTVDGVNLDNVISTPAVCTEGQVLQNEGDVGWSCVDLPAGGGSCTGPMFDHLTTNPGGYTGARSGYAAANVSCGAGQHICTSSELLDSINCPDSLPYPLPSTGIAWVSSGTPGFTSPAVNDCNGWKNGTSEYYGAYWDFTAGRGMATSCNTTIQFACCQ